jgi:hypothetical protein
MKRSLLCRVLCCIFLFGFLLGSYNGQLALWRDDAQLPWKVFPYPVATLPADTQRQLQHGIRIDNMEDLNRLLENFLS